MLSPQFSSKSVFICDSSSLFSSQKYIGGFAKLLRIDDIKKELQDTFKTQIDFIPDSNKSIIKDLIYV